MTWEETDDPYALVAATAGRPRRRIGVSDTLLAMHLLRLQAAAR